MTVRFNVNLNDATADAIVDTCQQLGITYTESIRRSVSLYKFVLDERSQGRRILTQDQDGTLREVVMLG